MLDEFADVMQNKPGRTALMEHSTDTRTANYLHGGTLPHAYRETVQSELKEMLESGIIDKSTSEWASPIVLVRKKGWLN